MGKTGSLSTYTAQLLHDSQYHSLLIKEFSLLLEQRFALYPVLGVELEFYLSDLSRGLRSDELTTGSAISIAKPLNSKAEQFLLALDKLGINCTAEKGENQYEIALPYNSQAVGLARSVARYKDLLTEVALHHQLQVDFTPKPFASDYGSSMHIHLSLHNTLTRSNLFSSDTIATNKIMQNCIAGVLSLLPSAMYFLAHENREEYRRFTSGFLAPTHISWGGNNRTVLIRIPDSLPENRRIEFRLPSAAADIQRYLIFLLVAISHGILNDLAPPERVYGNAHDPQYSLTPLPQNMEQAKKDFYFDQILANYVTLLMSLKEKIKKHKNFCADGSRFQGQN